MNDFVDPFAVPMIFANDIARIVPITSNLLCFDYYQLQIGPDGRWQKVIVARVARPAESVLVSRDKLTPLMTCGIAGESPGPMRMGRH